MKETGQRFHDSPLNGIMRKGDDWNETDESTMGKERTYTGSEPAALPAGAADEGAGGGNTTRSILGCGF